MTFKTRFLPVLLIVLSFLWACGQNPTNKKIPQTTSKKAGGEVLTIDTFSTFPPEIDGCSCYFSNDRAEFKKGKYIYTNDYAGTSFLKINGVMTRFTQTDFKVIDKTTTVAKAKSDKYEMTIKVVDDRQNGYETWLKKGGITLTDKNGKTITKTFYGECGC